MTTDSQISGSAAPALGGPSHAARPVAIEVRGVSKAFRLPARRVDTLKERATSMFRRPQGRLLQALRDVSFDIHEGDFFGIVGRNGSGKSTLLKLLASIYRVDTGRIRVAGRIAPCIELGVGFNQELTAHENVVLNGVMMGLTPRDAQSRFDEVIEFAGLGEYTDLKLKNYSSGMLVRLGFSLATQVDADILLVDEVLAVGDAAFQQKCFDVFAEQHARGTTIVLVTHDMGVVQSHCNGAILLERGSIVASGDPEDVARRYMELNFPMEDGVQGEDVPVEGGARRALIGELRLTDESGTPAASFEQGGTIGLEVTVEAAARLERPVVGFNIVNTEGRLIFGPEPIWLTDGRPLEPGERVTVRTRLENKLATGHYFVSASVALAYEELHPVAFRRNAADFTVFGNRGFSGLVELGIDAQVEQAR